jgi:hypothetical protein
MVIQPYIYYTPSAWATPHPSDLRHIQPGYIAPNWAKPHTILARPHPNWATPQGF